tara:strand:+ start:221 stop:484 length:264 start_codon:yes stop_codon:yes gene_type:complete
MSNKTVYKSSFAQASTETREQQRKEVHKQILIDLGKNIAKIKDEDRRLLHVEAVQMYMTIEVGSIPRQDIKDFIEEVVAVEVNNLNA